ncbi:transducin family protein / WD-40 repeat family protein isoform 1 [Galdieria sulphuraria]|uniref:Transducin family protein / WD-40 repeat family protein isoform 1 n=1 Tax=Galdieria sulphuraria TaxID=130081 RepID=M2Y2E7_GALSU|nr:transducin family protein / WD-40 repeat family protein isoform 1 [Galdieria sulphuraria]EME30133.1 transducin family protein / WD-40 repeat family protein isoform 1 [Galdieria sulphuraria]|eukprot:XP_005706653.1 transducin family protein / WD-40 repeat family protein isoform 1 [Galdieria sulphuraria]
MSNDETTSPTMVGSVEDEEEDDETFLDDSILTISWHKEPVYAVDCHPQLCHTFLTASGDGTACLWKIQDGSQVQPYHTVEERGDSQSLAKFSPNGTLFATACLDGSVQVFNASNGSLISDLVGPTSSVEFLRWFQDSSCLFAGCSDQTAWIWSMSDGNPVNVFTTQAPVMSGCLCRQDEYAVLGMEDGNISVGELLPFDSF